MRISEYEAEIIREAGLICRNTMQSIYENLGRPVCFSCKPGNEFKIFARIVGVILNSNNEEVKLEVEIDKREFVHYKTISCLVYAGDDNWRLFTHEGSWYVGKLHIA